MRKAVLAAVASLVVLTMSACGGGGNPAPPNNPVVTVSPATANVQEASQQQFTASVSNTSDNAVTWQVNNITGGNASVGTINSSGLYTAPAAIPNPASVTITAFITDVPGISGSAIATITSVQFGLSSLKGNYVFSLSGIDSASNSFYAVGAITADGNGNITGGEEDLNDVTSGYFNAPLITGTYTVGPDGRGTLNLNVPAISTSPFQYAFAMQALDNAVLNETDGSVVAATGSLETQATAVTAPSGNYAFGFSGSGLGCGAINSAGIFALSNGNVLGPQDVNCGGSIIQSQNMSGSLGTTVDSLGRGTGSFSGTSTGSSNLIYYVVSGNRFRFLCPDPATFFLGAADLQTQQAFASTDFNGSYVVNTSASTTAGVSYTLIYINASGGNVSSGYYDVNDTGNVGQAALSGAYTLATNGYVKGTWNVNGVGLPFALYLSSPTSGYYVDERTSVVGGGNITAQTGTVTGNAAWAGSYATKQFGYFLAGGVINSGNASAVTGQLSADGNGVLAGTLDINDPSGILLSQTLQGSYNVGTTAPGRFTAQITTPTEGSRAYVGYILDQGRVLLLETDSNLVSAGNATRQF
ncbi:MAG TPA: hypothetical protein VGG15_03080 [Terriglobales bacterium]|jgi:hypothetical protein